MYSKREQGAALIATLFIVALVAMLSTVIAFHERLLISTAQQVENYDSAISLLNGGRYWAEDSILTYTKKIDKTHLPPRHSLNHAKIGPLRIYGSRMIGTVIDQQGLFNINQVIDGNAKPLYYFLLALESDKNTGMPELTPQQLLLLSQNMKNWVDAHTRIIDVSQLRNVPGVTAQIYNAMSPYMAALPKDSQVNINSVNSFTLMSLSPDMPLSAAHSIIECLQNHRPFLKVDNFQKECVQNKTIQLSGNIDTMSQYFIFEGAVVKDHQQVNVRSLMELVREKNTNKLYFKTIWQKYS